MKPLKSPLPYLSFATTAAFLAVMVFGWRPANAGEAEGQALPGKSWVAFSEKEGDSAVSSVNAPGEIVFQAVGKPGTAFSGVYQIIPCTPGEELVCRAGVRVSETLQNARGQISIEWKDAKGGEIDRAFGPVWGPGFGEKEQGFEMAATAPDGTATAALVVTFFEEGGARGTCEVFDATVRR